METTRKRPSALGIASLILGLLATLTAMIPVCGLPPTFVLAAVGVVLGGVGLALAISYGRTGVGLPVAGIALCIVAVGWGVV
ncbi:MAG: hypothetical protein NTW19_01440 [Planctomycetota bacterium]|nr:hypothetical protein [Planctomycetota bacterium]